jgi:hypothetical protein
MNILIIAIGKILDALGVESFAARKAGLVLIVLGSVGGLAWLAVRLLALLARIGL